MSTRARRRAILLACTAFVMTGAGFTCDSSTEPLISDDEMSLASAGAYTVAGTVTVDGKPVNGAELRLWKRFHDYRARTNANGAYQHSNIAEGTYTILGTATNVEGLPPQLTITNAGTLDVQGDMRQDLGFQTHRVRFTVRLGDLPLAGARITNCSFPLNLTAPDGRTITGSQMLVGETPENGHFVTRSLPTAQNSTCRVYVPAPGTAWRSFVVTPITTDRGMTIRFPAISYSGTLRANGEAVAGQSVGVAGSLATAGETGAAGEFALAVTPGLYTVALEGAAPEGVHLPAQYSLNGPPASGGTGRSLDADVSESLDLPVHTLTVRVVDSADRPVAGASVAQTVSGAAFGLGAWTINDGSFALSGISDAHGVIRLPVFPTAAGFELGVAAPQGSRLAAGSAAVARITGDAEVTVALQGGLNAAPVAHAGGPYHGDEGSPIRLDGSASSDPDGDALTYEWVLSDGQTATGASPAFGFHDGAAAYTATLRVTDEAGESSETSTTITVRNVAPSVSAHSATVVSGESLELVAAFGDPGADEWDYAVAWPDGGSAKGALDSPGEFRVRSPAFLGAGTHTVRVTVRDDDGDEATAQAEVTVIRRSVSVDVLPGNPLNTLKLNPVGNGVLPVAILSDASFDATALDVASIRLTDGAGPGVPVAVRNGTSFMASTVDVDLDGRADLLVHFERQAAIGPYITEKTTEVVVWATTREGVAVEGRDGLRTH